MRVLVTGSRNWTDGALIKERLVKIFQIGEPMVLMHGTANGADTLAARWGQVLGYRVERYPADWNKYGKAAGPMRNRAMLDRNPDFVLAFQKDGSPGTQDTIDEARRRGIPVELYIA